MSEPKNPIDSLDDPVLSEFLKLLSGDDDQLPVTDGELNMLHGSGPES
jgi:hypothetical protein